MGTSLSNLVRCFSVTIQEYFDFLRRNIASFSIVLQNSLTFRDSETGSGLVQGHLLLPQDFRLYISEYVLTDPIFVRRKYRYHLQDSSSLLVRRWDDAPHHPHLPTFPYHCHMPGGGVVASPAMDLSSVLGEITILLK